jgi:agmatine/peptidylarginine deiminase
MNGAVVFKFLGGLAPGDARAVQGGFTQWLRKNHGCSESAAPMRASNLKLDGGNIVEDISGNRVIVTDRVLRDNASVTDLPRRLAADLQMSPSKLVIIPEDPEETVLGHADGCVAWLSESTIAVNAGPQEHSQQIREQVARAFEGVQVVDLPCVPHNEPYTSPGGETFESCKGIYTNILRTKRGIYVPQYGLDEDRNALQVVCDHVLNKETKNSDSNTQAGSSTAKDACTQAQTCRVVGVDCSTVAHMGGSVRCLTMTLPLPS